MSANLLNRILLDIPDEPKLLPGASNFSIPEGLSLPGMWLEALSRDVPSENALLKIWAPLATYIPQAVEKIIHCTMQLGLALYPGEEIEAKLMYVFQSVDAAEESPLGWSAGYPATEEEIAKAEARSNITLPTSYKKFARVHNGFNLYPMDVGPYATDNLWFISEGAKLKPDITYQADKLLACSGDGAGNQQCYDLMSPLADGDYLTYDWDHETHQITNAMSFWEYLDNLLITELRQARLRDR